MVNRGQFVKAAAVTAALLTLTVFSFKKFEPKIEGPRNPRGAQVFIDESYFGLAKQEMFIPSYNEMQPNVVSLDGTEKAHRFFEQVIKDNPTVNWRDLKEAGSFLTGLISKMKKSNNDSKEIAAYLMAVSKYKKVSPDAFLELEHPFCLERADVLAFMLNQLGFKANLIFFVEEMSAKEKRGHVLVVSRSKSGDIFFDPALDIVSTNIHEYVAALYAKSGETVPNGKKFLVMTVSNSAHLESRYSTPEKEMELDDDFSSPRVELSRY